MSLMSCLGVPRNYRFLLFRRPRVFKKGENICEKFQFPTGMDDSYRYGRLHVPNIFWGPYWFEQNCLPGTENVCEQYVIKKFLPAGKRGFQTVAACFIFDAGTDKSDKNYHVTWAEIEKFSTYGMKAGMFPNSINNFFCLLCMFMSFYRTLKTHRKTFCDRDENRDARQTQA